MNNYIENLLYTKETALSKEQQRIRDLVINSDDDGERRVTNIKEEHPVTNTTITQKTIETPQVTTSEIKIDERKERVEKARIRFELNSPKIIFIVPYRDRSQQRSFFAAHMLKILEDLPDSYYKIYYIQQNDTRDFNRGAMKNIGFSIVKNQYPTLYKNMTLVFNDVDVMPYNKTTINYETTEGVIKHFYGFKYALGGIFSIKASDFEKTNGFPNVWEWGYEDIIFQTRAVAQKLNIDYSQFFNFKDGHILKLNDNTSLENRNPSKYNISRVDGFNTIYQLNYTINEEDNIVNVNNFSLENKQNVTNTSSTLRTTNRRTGMMF